MSTFTATAITHNSANAGTIMYQHKESLTGKRADAYMDVYALGCIALELYALKRVWESISNAAELVTKIVMNVYPDSSTRLAKHHEVREIVQSCFKEPTERITMSEIVKQLSSLVDHEKYC